MFGTDAVLEAVIVCLPRLKAVTNGGARMITELIINDTERLTRLSFAPQALSMAPDDLLDHLAGALRASVAHPDEAVQAPAAATLSEVHRIQAAARRQLAVRRAELTARQIALIADHVGHALRVEREKLRDKSRR